MIHDLKTWPEHFEAVRIGKKTFELRRNDRPFRIGDMLRLQEYLPHVQAYTGRTLDVVVTHLIAGNALTCMLFGLDAKFVCMSIKRIRNRRSKTLVEVFAEELTSDQNQSTIKKNQGQGKGGAHENPHHESTRRPRGRR